MLQLNLAKNHCNKVQVCREGRRGSQGWRANGVFIVPTNKKVKHQNHKTAGRRLPAVGMTISWTDCARARAVNALSPLSRTAGPFLLSLRQSLELDTGVNHHSLAIHTARLRTRSPISAFRLPTPTSPHTPTARLRPGSPPACSPPPIPREEVGYSHLHPRPVDHLELKRL